jgi:hypothetical protein
MVSISGSVHIPHPLVSLTLTDSLPPFFPIPFLVSTLLPVSPHTPTGHTPLPTSPPFLTSVSQVDTAPSPGTALAPGLTLTIGIGGPPPVVGLFKFRPTG